jgi:hypothetical protein
MHSVKIDVSPKQLSRLRNGHKVRIKPSIKGKGFNLIVDPSRISEITKTFNRGKGIEIVLTPQEIATNQEASSEMMGQGIFGHKFDKALEKHGLKTAAYKIGDALKPAAKAALLAGLGAGATYLSGLETVATGGLGAGAIPLIYGTAGSLGALGVDYLDNPGKYQAPPRQSNAGGPQNKIAPRSLQGAVEQNDILNRMNSDLGTQYGKLSEATIANLEASKLQSAMDANRVATLKNTYTAGINNGYQPRNALGIYGYGLRREMGSIGRGGSFVQSRSSIHPALQSQPFSANFQFQHTLPPAYQKFSRGGGLYS